MLFPRRKWSVVDAASPEELADKLTNYSWCGCNGFRLNGYLFLNDSTCPDGAQEFGVIRESTMRQVESITFSWCNYQEALQYIQNTLDGEYEPITGVLDLTIQTPDEHGGCVHCY